MSKKKNAHSTPIENQAETVAATVLATHGRNFMVELNTPLTDVAARWQCVTRNRRNDIAVGDIVTVQATGEAQGVIETVEPRRSLLYRSDAFKSKLFAANVTQVWVVVATEPHFAPELIQRAVLAAQAAQIDCAVILNKVDLTDYLAGARHLLAAQGLAELGVPIIEVSAKDEAATRAALLPRLTGQSTLLMGQSGMGKSSLLNVLIPDASARTQAISAALNSGKHTTTFTQLYRLQVAAGINEITLGATPSYLVDSPGFQAFGLAHLGEEDLLHAFSEFHPYISHCRFYNCTHQDEPACGVRAAVEAGTINASRYALYKQILQEHYYAVEQRRGWH